MRLRHSHDRYYDLTAQLEQLSRDTTEMLLETLGSIPLVGNDIFQKHANLYLIQEGTGKTWAEYNYEHDPYVPRDVLSRARATKNMVDDYLCGVGMPRNNRRVEQMLGIGY